MILQALTRYYEDLLALGKVTRPGWSKVKVSYGLVLNDEGYLVQLIRLQEEVKRGQKTALVPRELDMPAPAKRTAGVAANFLCDTSSYLLGPMTKESRPAPPSALPLLKSFMRSCSRMWIPLGPARLCGFFSSGIPPAPRSIRPFRRTGRI